MQNGEVENPQEAITYTIESVKDDGQKIDVDCLRLADVRLDVESWYDISPALMLLGRPKNIFFTMTDPC